MSDIYFGNSRKYLAARHNPSTELAFLSTLEVFPSNLSLLEIKPPRFQKKYIGFVIGTIIAMHGVVLLSSQYFQSPPAKSTVPEPVVIEIIKPKEEPPKIIEPKVIQPKIPPITDKPLPPVLKKVVAPPKPQPVKTEKLPELKKASSIENTPVAEASVVQEVVDTAKVEPVQQPVIQAKGYAGYLSNPAPEYPDLALERGWEGSVLLRVKVAPNGSPLSVVVKSTSGKKILDDTAVKTVKRWKFMPAMQGSTPVEGWVDVPINFKLPQ